jgi:hypothetical protein
MAARLKIIRIPRTPSTAFDKHRQISDLVKNQVRHAHQELQAWWEKIGHVAPEQIETEQQAADYIRAVTRILHPEGTRHAQLPTGRPPKSGVSLDGHRAVARRPSRTRAKTRRGRR